MSRVIVVVGGLVVGVGLALLLIGRPGASEARHVAVFADARGLVEGNDVRVDGAIAGRVRSITLGRDGRARVSFTLDERVGRVHRDAAAAIRPVDLLGDNYLSLSPGRDPRTLSGPIGVARTSNAPRLDELLRSFTPSVRDGLQALLVEGGLALDRRGADLSRATVALRPALTAGDRVLDELSAQDGALARLVSRADRTVAQLDARRTDVGPLLEDLASTLRTTATARTGDSASTPVAGAGAASAGSGGASALDAGLADLPRTLTRLRSTATRLRATADAATPLAVQLRDLAPALTRAATGLEPLLGRASAASPALSGGLDAVRDLLVRGSAGFGAVTQGLRDAAQAAPDTDRLLDALVPAFPKISQGFLVDFPDQAREPGTQPFDPAADPRRAYWRGAAVFSCEAFGVEVAPGCLNKVLGAPSTRKRTKTSSKPGPAPARPDRAPDAPGSSSGGGTERPTVPAPGSVVPKVLDDVGRLLGGRPAAPAPTPSPAPQSTGELLDFLLG